MEGGPPCFRQDSSCPVVLRIIPHEVFRFSHTGLSPPLVCFPKQFCSPSVFLLHELAFQICPTTPYISLYMVWALPTSLAATMGISVDFFSCRYLDGSLPCVFLLYTIWFMYRCLSSRQTGYPIRRPGDRGILAPPPGFSQLITSFFAWQLLGILRRPFFA